MADLGTDGQEGASWGRRFERRPRRARKKFWTLRHTLDSRRKGKLKADTWMYRPRWWYVGQSDWPEITREFERGMLSVKPRNS
jgi:hypothetical protein